MADSDRPRDRDRTRDRDHRDHRDGTHPSKDNSDRPGASHDRRNRSRSPRRERGGRRSENNRYRSRSPIRRKERGADGDGRGDRDDKRGDFRGGWGPRPSGNNGGQRDRDNKPNVPKPSGPGKAASAIQNRLNEPEDVVMADSNRPEGMDDETWEMRKTMGFTGFKSTKDTKVPGNDKNYGIRKDKKMEARQYMNRQGGFNRPLSPGRG
jgi:U4/U6.U5 tri-snRNP-associated protein 3